MVGLIELGMIITLAAEGRGVDPALLRAICFVESSFRTKAVNHDDGGADNHSIGLCQVSIETARVLGSLSSREVTHCQALRPNCPLFDPLINAALAARYLRYQLDRYSGDEAKAISAYNAGSAITGNRRYVRKVLKFVKKLADG